MKRKYGIELLTDSNLKWPWGQVGRKAKSMIPRGSRQVLMRQIKELLNEQDRSVVGVCGLSFRVCAENGTGEAEGLQEWSGKVFTVTWE